MRPLTRDPLGFGLVGCGAIADLHVAALQQIPGVRVAAVADVRLEAAQRLAARTGATPYADHCQLAADPTVDVVTVCTPSGLREPIVLAAAAAGKQVVCEKPLEVTLARCDRMIAACAAAGVSLSGIFMNRYHSTYRKIKDAIAAGRFGRLVWGDVYVKWYRDQAYYDKAKWRATWALDGGGALMNQSVHFVDLLQWLVGPVRSVRGCARRLSHPTIEAEDAAGAVLEFANGALGIIQGTTAAWPGLHDRVELHGERGTVLVEAGVIRRWQFAEVLPGDAEAASTENLTLGTAADPMALPCELHRRQLADVIDHLRRGLAPPINGHEARKAVEIIAAIYQASATDRTVTLPVDPGFAPVGAQVLQQG